MSEALLDSRLKRKINKLLDNFTVKNVNAIIEFIQKNDSIIPLLQQNISKIGNLSDSEPVAHTIRR